MMCQLQYQSWDDRTVSIDLRPGRYRVGRNADNDIVIDELAVSGRHCLIKVGPDGKMRVEDQGSTSGIFVDGAPVDAAEVKPGQMLHLGTFMVKILGSDSDRSSTEGARMESVPLSDGSYSCLKHQDQRATYECEHCFHLFCDACLPDEFDKETSNMVCPNCGKEAIVIDWSGLNMSSRDAAMEMMPDSVKRALNYWNKWKDFRETQNGSKGGTDKNQSD